MKYLKIQVLLAITVLISACGSTPQPTVTLNTNLLAKEGIKVGIVYIAPEKRATTHIYGASCLLCYGVASSLTSKLDTHLETTISSEELTKMKDLVISEYSARTKNVEIVSLPKPIKKFKKFKGELGYAKKDFRFLKEELGVDIVAVFQLFEHGARRTFSSYVPTSDPKGYVSGMLYSIDLDTNAYVQYLKIFEEVQPVGEWDEPTDFPSVTTSYYQAVENTKLKIKDAI